MKILLTNDDGIDAPGLAALWDSVQLAFADLNPEIIVVAPDRGRSECGHSVTGGRALTLIETKPGWFSLDGTPVDCVRVALTTLMPEPTLTFSGVNAGANLGVNLMVSGTFAAAREVAVHGFPAMAVSHYRRPNVPKSWGHVPRWVESTMHEFHQVAQSTHETVLWNTNLPAIAPDSATPAVKRCGIDRCPIERQPVRKENQVSFDLDFHARARAEGTDVDLCFQGFLTISQVSPHFLTT